MSIGALFLKEDSLPKLLHSGNKMIQEVGDLTLEEILKSVPGFISGIIPHLLALYSSRSGYVRLKSVQYLEIILFKMVKTTEHPAIWDENEYFQFLENNQAMIEYFLINSVQDGKTEVRAQARYCLLIYRDLFL